MKEHGVGDTGEEIGLAGAAGGVERRGTGPNGWEKEPPGHLILARRRQAQCCRNLGTGTGRDQRQWSIR